MVIRQLLLPAEGGGSLRRFLAVRSRLYRDQWNDDRILRGPVPLFDFRRPDDVADLRDALKPERTRGLFGGWRASDDSVIGGYSTSNMEFVEGLNNEDGDADSSVASSPPFLRWSGRLSTKINRSSHLAKNITRSGFAAILSPEFPFGAPLNNKYKALEICCRTDGRTYAVNLNVETYFPEDMYQGFIGGDGGRQPQRPQLQRVVNGMRKSSVGNDSEASTSIHDGENERHMPRLPHESLDVREHIKNTQNIAHREDPNNHPYHGHPPLDFQRFLLPFREFALTSRGRLRQQQRALDGCIQIESIGFTLMDGKDGDFCFDLVSMRAVNVMAGEVVGTIAEDAEEEKLHHSLRAGGKKKEEGKEEEEENPEVKRFNA